jgi:DNA-binding transcriptional ArsR family regulator
MEEFKVLDAVAIKALAHPLRLQLFDLVRREGPATSTSLAKRLNETSGATSYHLRQLHRAGLIEEDPDRGTGRERWWRPAQRSIAVRGSALPDDPTTQAAAQWFAREIQRRRNAWVERWYDTHKDWPQEWQDASVDSSAEFRTTHEHLRALQEEILEVIDRYRAEAEANETPDSERVAVMFYAFPQPPTESAGEQP